MNSSNYTQRLPTNMCLLLQMPESRKDCSIYNQNACVQCRVLGKFIAGDDLSETGSAGHTICILIWLIICLVGICGAFGNMFIVHILQRQKRGVPFDTLLIALAWIDMLCCFISLVPSTSAIVYFQNLSTDMFTLYGVWLGSHSILFLKSASSFMTVVITFERFLAIAFPLKAGRILSHRKTYFLIAGVLLVSIINAVPRFSSMKVTQNLVDRNITATSHLDHLILATSLHRLWYKTLKGFFNQMDFWAPLPLLLLFNGLIYFYILRFTSKRKDMNVGQRKEIRAVKMFFPVVVVLFLCNIIPIVHYALIRSGVIYRELQMCMYASFAFNSAANLPIYYYKGAGFKSEARAVIIETFPVTKTWFQKANDENSKTTSTGLPSK